MAYVFKNIEEELNKDKSDIFQPDEPKTTISPSAVAAQKAQPVKPQDTMAPAVSAFKTQQAKPQLPEAYKSYSEKVLGRKADVEKAAQDWLANIPKPEEMNLTSEDISGLKGNEPSTFGKIKTSLGQTFKLPKDFSYNVPMPEEISLNKILSDVGGRGYTGGESAFERALITRSPEYQKLKGETDIAKEAMVETERKIKADIEKEAIRRGTETLSTSQTELRDELQKFIDDLIEKAKNEEAAEEARRASLNTGEFATTQAQTILDNLKKDNPLLADYITLEGIDPTKYAKLAGDVDYRSFITPEQATTFANVMSLLGKGGELVQPGSPLGEAQSFDVGEFSSEILDRARAARGQAVGGAQKEIEDILSGVQTRTSEEAQKRAQMKIGGKYDSEIYALPVKASARQDPRYGKDTAYTNAVENAVRNVKSGDFYKVLDVPSWQQAFRPEEIDRIRTLYNIVGVEMPQFGTNSLGQQYIFDRAGFKEAFNNAINAELNKLASQPTVTGLETPPAPMPQPETAVPPKEGIDWNQVLQEIGPYTSGGMAPHIYETITGLPGSFAETAKEGSSKTAEPFERIGKTVEKNWPFSRRRG